MKFIELSNVGGTYPDVLHQMLYNKPFPSCRYDPDTINFIEQNAVDFNSITNLTLYQYLEQNPNAIVLVRACEDKYYGWCDKYKFITGFTIKEIDPEHKRYIMTEYDGAECIKELPQYKLVDRNCSLYCEKIKTDV